MLSICNNNRVKSRKKNLKTFKEHRKLSLLLVSMNGKEQIFHHTQKTGKSLNKTIRCNTILNK